MNQQAKAITNDTADTSKKHIATEDFDLSRTQWIYLIDEYIFSERDRRLTKRRLLDGITFEQLAEEEYLSVQRTKEIFYKSRNILFKHIV